MKPRERPWLALLPLALVASGTALALALTSDHEEHVVATSTLVLVLSWSFIGTGLFGWARRPDNATGALMVGVGFTWLLTSLWESNWSFVHTVGMAIGSLPLAVFIHLVLAYPDGRVDGRWERVIVAAAYPAALLANLSTMLVDPTGNDSCTNCPANAFLVVESSTTANALEVFWDLVGLAFMVVTAVVLARHWRAATGTARRVLTPVYLGGLVSVSLVGIGFALDQVTNAADIVITIGIIAFASVPFFFLTGLLRTRLARTGAVQLLQDTPEAPSIEEAQAALRRALSDPTLRLLVKEAEGSGYRDADGFSVEVPEESEHQAVTRLAYEGLLIAAVVFDPALRREPELLRDVFAAARLALVKDRSVQALRVSERRNRALLDAIPDNMFRILGDGTFVDFHSNLPDALALPPERILGSNIRDHLPPEEAAARLESIQRVIRTGRSETVETQFLERSGRLSDREIRMVKSGENEIVSINRDITDRKHAEQEVVLQRDFLTTVVNTAKSIFLVVTPEGRITRFNDFTVELTGHVDDDRARGRLFWELFAAAEDAEAVREAFASGVQGREYEHRWVSASGERRLVAWSATPLVDETGEERRLIHGADVTERRRQEEELRQQYDFLVTIGRATPSMLAVVDEDGRVGPHGVSESFTRRLGPDDRTAIGSTLWELVAPRDEAKLRQALAEAALGVVGECEGTWLGSGGEALSVAWSVHPVGNLDGRPSYLVCGVDVTEQKRQQEELKRSRTRLVEAEAAERRRLERNLHDGAQQRLVSVLLTLRLLQSKLSSDPDGAREILDTASVELGRGLEELRELARGIHPAILTDRGLALALEGLAERALFPVELDAVPAERLPEQIEVAAFYVVSEAVTNVAKYAQASCARISITCEEQHVVIEIVDDGIGGADETRGTGLRGLADRVEALDGRFVVDSPPGRGTSVRAVIPLLDGAAVDVVRLAAPQTAR